MNFSFLKDFASSTVEKIKNASPRAIMIGVMAIVALLIVTNAFAYTENKDGTVTLTPDEVKTITARFTSAMQNINDLADVIRENADTIEKMKKQIEVGPNKTCL